MLYNRQFINKKMKYINQIDKLFNNKKIIVNITLNLFKNNYIKNKKN